MAITIGERFLFGVVEDKPALPAGWKYIERPGHWLLAESDRGETWIVAQDKIMRYRRANWLDWIRTLSNYFRGWRPLKPGQMFIDDREKAILFSQLEPA